MLKDSINYNKKIKGLKVNSMEEAQAEGEGFPDSWFYLNKKAGNIKNYSLTSKCTQLITYSLY